MSEKFHNPKIIKPGSKLLLGELSPTKGELDINGSFSYCSQDAWIFLGSIRQNVLFGLDYDPQRYARVIKTACLSTDLDLFPLGDKTIVGDKGIRVIELILSFRL